MIKFHFKGSYDKQNTSLMVFSIEIYEACRSAAVFWDNTQIIRVQDKQGLRIIQSFSYFSTKTYVLTPHSNHLEETVLMMGHKICFNGKMWIINPELSHLPRLIWST